MSKLQAIQNIKNHSTLTDRETKVYEAIEFLNKFKAANYDDIIAAMYIIEDKIPKRSSIQGYVCTLRQKGLIEGDHIDGFHPIESK